MHTAGGQPEIERRDGALEARCDGTAAWEYGRRPAAVWAVPHGDLGSHGCGAAPSTMATAT